ncbi:hypothetical protein [Variovorax sp. J22R115]|uniref:hypothetical protein n=1 Tax=Variovorax sp. J22R115 TaxID=3053509 RepID=UPI0025767084|nr:hypothetical protein [Variovorax sp. J22R115]MDM0053552.1 hypothetical protein [Variovorax sp. J22R115]
MTFRIDKLHLTDESNAAWRLVAWFKGLNGRPVHANAQFIVGDGRLLLRRSLDDPPLVVMEGFDLSLPPCPGEVRIRLAKALTDLGWGPEIPCTVADGKTKESRTPS